VVSYVEALLWKIEYAVRNKMTGVSCTDEAARWNKGTATNIEPMPLLSIQLKKTKLGVNSFFNGTLIRANNICIIRSTHGLC
jgi:hypothetical protein